MPTDVLYTQINWAKDLKSLDLQFMGSTANPLPKYIFSDLRGYEVSAIAKI